MSFPFPFGSNESQPQVRLETFEDLTTVRKAVGEVRGLDDPVTTELLQDTRHSLRLRHDEEVASPGKEYEFEPKVYSGDEAKIIVRALRAVAKDREDEMAQSAAYTLRRMPLQLRAATFMSSILSPESPKHTDAPKSVSGPLFDPSVTEKRPPVEWKSKYDQSHKGKKF